MFTVKLYCSFGLHSIALILFAISFSKYQVTYKG